MNPEVKTPQTSPSVDNMGTTPTPPETAQPQDPTETDPTLFLAKQVLQIRDQLKADMVSIKKEMSEMIQSAHKKDMDEIKGMIKNLLNE